MPLRLDLDPLPKFAAIMEKNLFASNCRDYGSSMAKRALSSNNAGFLIAATAALFVSGCTDPDDTAASQSPEAPEVLSLSVPSTAVDIEEKWANLEDNCRGAINPSTASAQKACADRDKFENALNSQGWCHGNPEDAGYQRRWIKCSEQNQRPDVRLALRYQDEFHTYDTVRTVRTYLIENVGSAPVRVEWVKVNNRDECFALPIVSSYDRKIRELRVLDERDSDEVAGYVNLNVGESIPIKMGQTPFKPISKCGRMVRALIKTEFGEIEIVNATGL